MPRELRKPKVGNYTITTWDSKLLVIGGMIQNGAEVTTVDSIWALDCKTFSEENHDWQKMSTTLAIPGFDSCAVTTGDLLTVMSGFVRPSQLIKKVYVYNLQTGHVVGEGDKEIEDHITDCSTLDSFSNSAIKFAIAIGQMERGSGLQIYLIEQDRLLVNVFPSFPPIYQTQLQPARTVLDVQNDSIDIVGGTMISPVSNGRGITPNVVYSIGDDGVWNRGQPFPGCEGDVIGVIQ